MPNPQRAISRYLIVFIYVSPSRPWRSIGKNKGSETIFQGWPKETPPQLEILSPEATPLGVLKAAALWTVSPGCTAGIQGASAVRMFHLYKEMLTVQVLFLGAHHFMSGGFADCSGYSGACHAVLSRGDPIRERLARHFLSLLLLSPFLRGGKKGGDGPTLTRRPYPRSTQAFLPPATRRLSSLCPPWYHF